jgi:hypothetical protein
LIPNFEEGYLLLSSHARIPDIAAQSGIARPSC